MASMETPRPRSTSSASASASFSMSHDSEAPAAREARVTPNSSPSAGTSTTPKTPAPVALSSSLVSTTTGTPTTIRRGILRRPETPSSSSRVGWGYRETNTGDVSKISSLADTSAARSVSASLSITSESRRTTEDRSDVSGSSMASSNTSRSSRRVVSADQSSSSLADESSFASSSYVSRSRASRIRPAVTASLRDPMQTPRPSTLKARPIARDASLSMSIGNMSSEQTNQSVLFDAVLPNVDFTAAFPSPRRKSSASEDVQPTPRPVKRTREVTKPTTEETPQRLLPPGKQSPGSKVSGDTGSDASSAQQANLADGSFSINESLWRSEGARFLKRYQEVEQEEQQQQHQQQRRLSVESPPAPEEVHTSPASTSVAKVSPPRSATPDRSLPSSSETKTPKPASRTRKIASSPDQSTEKGASPSRSTTQGADRTTEAGMTRPPGNEQQDTEEPSTTKVEESVKEAASDDSHADAEESVDEASFSTPGAIERSMSYSHASLPCSPDAQSPDSFASLRFRRPMTPSSAQGPSPGNMSFSTARDHESSPAAAKLQRKGMPQMLQDLVLPAPMPGARLAARVEKVETPQAADEVDDKAIAVVHASLATDPTPPADQSHHETDQSEADALLRLSAVRSALEEFTTAQSIRLGTLSVRLEQDQSEATRLRSLLSNELQSRVALLDEMTSTKLELDRLREERERVRAEREQERLWVGQRDEELRSLVRKLEQQLERRFSASASSVKLVESGQSAQTQELKAELERERQARAMERRDLEIRLAAAMSGANTASSNSDNEDKGLDTALVNQKALAEAVRQARESIERDHEVKVYRMEREHEEALEALQDQLDRAEADRSGVSSERDSKQVAVLEAEIARLERALQDASDFHSNTSGEKNTVLADDLAQLRGQKEEAERLAGQRLQIINDLEVDIGRFHGERATNARQLDSLREAAEAVEGEVVQPLRTEVATLETAVKRLEGEKAAAERQSQQDAEGFEHEIAQSEEERERAEFLLQEAQVERKNLAEEVQVLQQSIAELETESSQQAERIAELEQELAAARDQLDSSLVTASSSRTSLEAQLSSLQEALELAHVTKSSIHSRLVAVEAEVKTLSTRNEVLAREASDSDMKRLKLQKANEVLYAEFEKMGIALETKQLEVEMLKRKVKKPDVLGEGHKDGTAKAVEARKARHAGDTLAALDREAEDSHTAEVLLEKGPNPLRARGRKTIDPWAQQQAALASRDSDNDNGRTPTAATSRAGTTISSSRAGTKASESHQSAEISARRLSSRTATDKPRSVLGPSSVGNTSHSRTSRVSRASKYSVDLSETEDASKSQIKETSRATGSAIGGATTTAAVPRRGSSSSLSSNLTAASSTSSRSKHSVHDSRGLTGATMPMEMRRGNGASITSQQSASQSASQSRDEPMSLDELRTELATSTSVDRSASANASGTGTARLRGSYSSSSSSLLASRSLATRSISVSQPSYSQSRRRQRQGHGSDAGSELMDLVESDADADADADLELELEGHTDGEEDEEDEVGQTTPTSRSQHTRIRSSETQAAEREREAGESASLLSSSSSSAQREKRLEAAELRVPRSLLASARSNRRRQEEREREREREREWAF